MAPCLRGQDNVPPQERGSSPTNLPFLSSRSMTFSLRGPLALWSPQYHSCMEPCRRDAPQWIFDQTGIARGVGYERPAEQNLALEHFRLTLQRPCGAICLDAMCIFPGTMSHSSKACLYAFLWLQVPSLRPSSDQLDLRSPLVGRYAII